MIYLLRHGETVWNREGRLQGQRDSPLTRTGIAQAEAMGQRLGAEIGDPRPWAIVASPLGRAQQSAAIVAEMLGLEPGGIAHEPRLVEIGFGAWEGLTVAEVEAAEPGAWARRVADRWNVRPPGGESFADLEQRAVPWLAPIPESARLIVIAHGVTNRVLRGTYAGLPPSAIVALPESQDELYRLGGGRFETLATGFPAKAGETA